MQHTRTMWTLYIQPLVATDNNLIIIKTCLSASLTNKKTSLELIYYHSSFRIDSAAMVKWIEG